MNQILYTVYCVVHCTVNLTVQGCQSGWPILVAKLPSLPSGQYFFPEHHTVGCTVQYNLHLPVTGTGTQYFRTYYKKTSKWLAFSFRITTPPTTYSMYCTLYGTIQSNIRCYLKIYCTLYCMISEYSTIHYNVHRCQFASLKGFFSKENSHLCSKQCTIYCPINFIVH